MISPREIGTAFSKIKISWKNITAKGFSSVFSEALLGTGALWVKIAIPNPTNGNGQFSDDVNSIVGGSYSQTHTNMLLVNAILLIKAQTTQKVGMSIVTDPSRISSSKYGVFQTRPKQGDGESTSYCLAGLLELSANQPLSLYIHVTISESFEILAGSRVSVISARHSYPAFHVIYENQIQYSSRDIWLSLDKWTVKRDGSFSLIGSIGESYETRVSGVFLIAANIIFHDANGPVSALISINGDTSKRKSIYATNGHPSADKETLTMSGAIYVNEGSKISVRVKTEQDLSWYIAGDSSFSCSYLGNVNLIPAVSTVLIDKLPFFSSGWKKLTGWTPQTLNEGFFESGKSFNYETGEYVVPEDGLYVVSANIKFQLASDKDSEFKLNIAVNGDPSRARYQNGIQDYVKISKAKPFSNDYYSMVSSGVVRCSKGNTIAFYVSGQGDSNYEVSQDSSMSIVFVSPLKTHYTGGMHVMLAAGISQVNQATFSWRKVKHWESSIGGTAPGLFLEQNLFRFESTDGIFDVLETGIYYITVNVGVLNGNNEFEIGVHASSSEVSSLHTIYGRTSVNNPSETRSAYSMKAFGILFLEKEQRISIEIKSDGANQEWENNRAVTGWTVVRLPPYFRIPRVMYGSHSNEQLPSRPGVWSRITSWSDQSSPYTKSSADLLVNGIYTVQHRGLFLVSTTVAIDDDVSASDFVKIKIGINGDISLPGSQILNPGEGPSCFVGACSKFCTQTCSHIVMLAVSNTVGIYIQSSKSQVPIHTASSVLVQYLQPTIPLPSCFSMKLQNTQSINTQGSTSLTQWIANENNLVTFFNDGGLEISRYRLPSTGFYFAVVNIELSNLNGDVDLAVLLNSETIISSTYLNNDDRSFSISLHGFFAARGGDSYNINLNSKTDSSYSVAENSFNSLWHIGGTARGFSAQYELEATLDMKAETPIILNYWLTNNQQWLFDFTNNLISKQTFVVQKTGIHIIGGNFIIDNQYANSVSTSVYVVLNGNHDYKNILQSTTLLNNQKRKTVEINGEMFLEKWNTIEIALKTDKEITLSIKRESMFFAILQDGSNDRIGCLDNGPNVISVLSPAQSRAKFGADIQWTCKATGENIQYSWEKDGEILSGESSQTLQLTSMKREDSGDYTCVAKADGIEDSSNAANIYVFDPSPYFLNDEDDFTIRVQENGDVSQVLLAIRARAESFESGDSEMAFSLKGDTGNIFTINPYLSKTGTTLSRTSTLDREEQDVFYLQILANTPSIPDSERQQNITIIVTDLNDNAPVFEENFYNISVKEDITPGTQISTIKAIDPDENNIVSYKLIRGTSPIFQINGQTGELTVAKAIDKMPGEEYIFYIIASDGQQDEYARAIVYVQDVNNNRPRFINTNYVGAFSSALSPNNKIIQVLAIDDDYGDNAKIIYSITKGDEKKQFIIMDDGTIELSRHLDNTDVEMYELEISIRDSGTPPLEGVNKANVTLSVRTASDNRPIFSRVDYKMVIPENSLDARLQVSAVDATGDAENLITYSIPPVYNVSHTFKISLDGLITLKIPLDYEQTKLYAFAVEARDSGLPPKVATAYVTVTVLDENDNQPIFANTSATITVKETTDTSKALYEVSANDKDSPEFGSIRYRFLSGNEGDVFFVNSAEGFVRANKPLDYEQKTAYTLVIGAFDSGQPSLRSATPFTLKVILEDINDNPPEFNKDVYELTITENAGTGDVLTKFTVTDRDAGVNREFDVELIGEFAKSTFEISAADQSIGVYNLIMKDSVDYEQLINLKFYMRARDKGEPGLESRATVEIKVNDINDNPPRFQGNASVVITSPLKDDLYIYRAVATDSDRGPGDKLRYFITDGNNDGAFKIEQFTGDIRVNDTSKLSYGKQYKLTIKAEDSFTPPMVSQPFVLTITTAVALVVDNTISYQYQFKTTLMLDQFSHLRNIEKIQILVQLYKTSVNSFFFLTQQEPLSYYQVFFGEEENKVRRYVALDIPLPITRRIQRRAVEKVPEQLEVLIGEDSACDKKDSQNLLICNGPLIPGEEYRVQVHVFQVGNAVPYESYFSNTIKLREASSESASSSPQISPTSEDGMLAMAATFGLVYITVVLVILIFVFWKQRHELLHVDHLRERRDIIDDANFFSGKEFYSTSDLGSVTKKYPQFDDDSLIWPDLNNSGNSNGTNVLHPIEENEESHQMALQGKQGASNDGFIPDELQDIPVENIANEIPIVSMEEGDISATNNDALTFDDDNGANELSDEVVVFDDKQEEESDENHETASNEPIYESADRIRDAINLRNDQGKGKIRKTYADSKFELNLYSDSSEYSMRKGLINTSKNNAEQEDDGDGQAILL